MMARALVGPNCAERPRQPAALAAARVNRLENERRSTSQALRFDQYHRASARRAAYAGGAYPRDPESLLRFLEACATRPGGPGAWPSVTNARSPRALIAPHIDLHRGGHSYAWAYGALARCEPAELYVLLGTSHLPMRHPFTATAESYDTPLGPVPTDTSFLGRLAARTPYDPCADEYAHKMEHSLEFQAVCLRYLGHAPTAPIVPILCALPLDLPAHGTPADSHLTRAFLEALRETIVEDGRRVSLIVGADFAHVGPGFGDRAPIDRKQAQRVQAGDAEMLNLVTAGDAQGFYRQVVEEAPWDGMASDGSAVGGPRRICGLAPMYAALRLLGPSRGRVLHYDQWIDGAGVCAVSFGCVLFP